MKKWLFVFSGVCLSVLLICCGFKNRTSDACSKGVELSPVKENIQSVFSQSVDSIVVKLSRYDWECQQGRLMTRYVFDYFFERIWEESGKADIAFYTGETKNKFVGILSRCQVLGVSPVAEEKYGESQMCRLGEGEEDLSIIGKIEFYKGDELINILWCSHDYLDGMECYNFVKRLVVSQELREEFDRIHNAD